MTFADIHTAPIIYKSALVVRRSRRKTIMRIRMKKIMIMIDCWFVRCDQDLGKLLQQPDYWRMLLPNLGFVIILIMMIIMINDHHHWHRHPHHHHHHCQHQCHHHHHHRCHHSHQNNINHIIDTKCLENLYFDDYHSWFIKILITSYQDITSNIKGSLL